MFDNRRKFSSFFLVLIVEIVVFVIGVQATELNNDLAKKDIFYLRNADKTDIIDTILSPYIWAENHECLAELSAIRNGLKNYEEWAIKGRSYLFS